MTWRLTSPPAAISISDWVPQSDGRTQGRLASRNVTTIDDSTDLRGSISGRHGGLFRQDHVMGRSTGECGQKYVECAAVVIEKCHVHRTRLMQPYSVLIQTEE